MKGFLLPQWKSPRKQDGDTIITMTFFRSYCPNYFSIQDIMVTQEKVPCKTETTLRRLGFLCADNEKEDIEEGLTLELPYWLAQKLSYHRRKIIKLDIPKVYKERTRDIFEADAKVINLFKVHPHFYEFGCYLINISHRENELIQSVITQAFKQRFRLIMDWADNVMTEPIKVQQLEYSERNLLKIGQKSRILLDSWLTQGVSKMKAADMVLNFNKRKLLALEND